MPVLDFYRFGDGAVLRRQLDQSRGSANTLLAWLLKTDWSQCYLSKRYLRASEQVGPLARILDTVENLLQRHFDHRIVSRRQ